ncbi:All-trans-phytoene synthase [Poriferisphaera corsica]|uniref:All-trans-phytoene synthase n=1 Tax=Poriferisphaera corsica TaxID=2528020 RepID=A0A517YTC7_9BACT|nr:squalene synthase HpnC [Poriferisphaera corsica]QDU33487.1 All-trans-phytoene synthase [Poriferisphaera corsica]
MNFSIHDQLKQYGPERLNGHILTLEEATAYTRSLTLSHYENFTVVSWFLPKRLRADFSNVYAFCRWADDLGDEIGDQERSLELLEWFEQELDACYAGRPRHPVFVALSPTIEKHDIPKKPFRDLIDAFKQDQRVTRYDNWAQVVDYCTRSANPVGHLVLYMCGYRDAYRQQLSDSTCTALQLANFWQDIRRDIIERDRVYIPSDIASKHDLSVESLVSAILHDHAHKNPNSCAACPTTTVALSALRGPAEKTVRELVQKTWPLFEQGAELLPLIAPDVRLDIKLFSMGGESILRMIERNGYDTLTRRPSLSKPAKMSLMMRAFVGKILTPFATPQTSI